MNLIKFQFVFFLLLCFSLKINSKRSFSCGWGSNCIPLQQCLEINKHWRQGMARNIMKVRSSICAFKRRITYVCCPRQANPRFPLALELGSSLLPKNCGQPMIRNKIFGGRPTPIGAYPWVAALGYRVPDMDSYMYDCSGSIINEKYILTAAHCVHRRYTGRKRFSVIQLGTWNLASEEDCEEDRNRRRRGQCHPHMISGFEEVIIHPEFDEEADSAHDIALIRLNTTLNFNRNDNVLIEPVCLPPSTLQLRDLIGKRAIAAGWGFTEHKNYSTVLLSVELPILNTDKCLQLYRSQFIAEQLCAGGIRGEDTCVGDSGGPLFLSDPLFTQVGIVSFGQAPCGRSSIPSVYTFVPNYKKWIEENLKP